MQIVNLLEGGYHFGNERFYGRAVSPDRMDYAIGLHSCALVSKLDLYSDYRHGHVVND